MKHFIILLLSLLTFTASAQRQRRPIRVRTVPRDSIILSDPCIFPDTASHIYYMTGTGGMLWKSRDLEMWTGPYNVVDIDSTSWMGPRPMIWAAELHPYQGKYYYFATFTNVLGRYRWPSLYDLLW